MKFDIYNKTTKQTELGLFAETPQLLKQLYAMNDEAIEIVKVYNEEPQNILTPVDQKTVEQRPVEQKILDVITELPKGPTTHPGINVVEPPPFLNAEKFFTDNGVEYKINAEGSFKKSWVNIIDVDSYRIINDKTGKIVNLTGKTIQTLDWVKIG